MIVIIPDLHLPWVNQRALNKLLNYIHQHSNEITHVVQIGDLYDFYFHSKFRKNVNLCTPEQELQKGYKLAASMWKKIKNYAPKAQCFQLLGNHCLSTDTEVLTKRGWKNYLEVDLNDEVATMDSTQTLEWQKPYDKIIRDLTDGEYLYTYDSSVASLSVTDNHRVYYRTSSGYIKVKPACEVPDSFNVITTLTTNSKVDLTDDEIRLAAWICTDCHVNKHGYISLYQAKKKVHLILELLDRMGIEYRVKERVRNIKAICGKTLKSVQPQFEIYLGADVSKKVLDKLQIISDKTLPLFVPELSNEQFDIFLETLILGDGTMVKNKNWRVFYGEKKICEDVQVAAFLHGWRASITEYRHNQFRVNLTKQPSTRVEKWHEHKNDSYQGQVWCLSVPNENFVVRRNNKIHVTGNCNRLQKRISEQLPEITSLTKQPVDDLFTFEGVTTLHDSRQTLKIKGVHFFHGYMTGDVGKHLKKLGISCVTGHAHTPGVFYQKTKDKVLFELRVGHLADTSALPLNYTELKLNSGILAFGIIKDNQPSVICLELDRGVK